MHLIRWPAAELGDRAGGLLLAARARAGQGRGCGDGSGGDRIGGHGLTRHGLTGHGHGGRGPDGHGWPRRRARPGHGRGSGGRRGRRGRLADQRAQGHRGEGCHAPEATQDYGVLPQCAHRLLDLLERGIAAAPSGNGGRARERGVEWVRPRSIRSAPSPATHPADPCVPSIRLRGHVWVRPLKGSGGCSSDGFFFPPRRSTPVRLVDEFDAATSSFAAPPACRQGHQARGVLVNAVRQVPAGCS